MCSLNNFFRFILLEYFYMRFVVLSFVFLLFLLDRINRHSFLALSESECARKVFDWEFSFNVMLHRNRKDEYTYLPRSNQSINIGILKIASAIAVVVVIRWSLIFLFTASLLLLLNRKAILWVKGTINLCQFYVLKWVCVWTNE